MSTSTSVTMRSTSSTVRLVAGTPSQNRYLSRYSGGAAKIDLLPVLGNATLVSSPVEAGRARNLSLGRGHAR